MEIFIFSLLGCPILLVILVVLAILYSVISGAASSGSHLKLLQTRYPAPTTHRSAYPAGLFWRTVQIGPVRWRNCVDIGFEPGGLYLHIRQPLISRPPILIPYTEIHPVRQTMLYLRPAVELSIGTNPAVPLVIFPEVYQQLSPYLRLESQIDSPPIAPEAPPAPPPQNPPTL